MRLAQLLAQVTYAENTVILDKTQMITMLCTNYQIVWQMQEHHTHYLCFNDNPEE